MTTFIRTVILVSVLLACPASHLMCMGMQMEAIQSQTDEKKPSLHYLALQGDAAALLKALQSPTITRQEIDQLDYQYKTALHYAAEGGYYGCIHCLFYAGATVNTPDKSGYTPLVHAIMHAKKYQGQERNNLLACVEFLVLNGADISSNFSIADIADAELQNCVIRAFYTHQQTTKNYSDNSQMNLNYQIQIQPYQPEMQRRQDRMLPLNKVEQKATLIDKKELDGDIEI